MRVAYADPPYIGQARKHYGDDPRCAEVDHAALITQLCTYDAWALSCSSPSLKVVLALCPDDVRVGAWVKPFAIFKPNVNPAYAWEPVIFWHGRNKGRECDTLVDWVAANVTLQTGTHGAKPAQFCFWLFGMLGLERGDELVDLYPGSGAVVRAWEAWKAQSPLMQRQRVTADAPLFAEVTQ